MKDNSTAPADPASSDSSEIPQSERQRLEHLSDELDVQFDIDHLSAAEAKQLLGELDKRAAREGQEDHHRS